MTQIEVHKAVAYAVEQPVPEIRVHKAVVYAVEQPVTDNTGDARQSVSDRRPRYRTGPVPYAEFEAGDFLTLVTTTAGTYTALFYKPDDTFEQQELTLVVGANAIPTVNFNQAVIVPGVPTAATITKLQDGMRARVIPTATPLILLSGDMASGESLLLEGDMTGGTDRLLVEGDMTDGDDTLLVQGDAVTSPGRLGLSGDMTDGDDIVIVSGG